MILSHFDYGFVVVDFAGKGQLQGHPLPALTFDLDDGETGLKLVKQVLDVIPAQRGSPSPSHHKHQPKWADIRRWKET